MEYKSITTKSHSRGLLIVVGILVLILAFAIAFNASAAPEGTEVGGAINTDTTWTLAGSPYIVVNNVSVTSSATLTIQPGVEVRFRVNTRLRIEGQLLAQGNPGNLIKFTSEDAVGYPGYWSGIFFKDTGGARSQEKLLEQGGGNILQYCVVEFAGSNEGAVRIQNSATLVDHCTIRNNSQGGILVVANPGLAVALTFNDVAYNKYAGNGAGIVGIDSTITDNIVTHNYSTGVGAGIFATRDPNNLGNSVVRDNIVGHNTALGDGGGIYASNSFVSGNFIHDNNGNQAGGILSSNSTFFSGNTIVRNRSGGSGAGVYYIGSTQFTQNTIVDNSTTPGFAYGGVILNGAPTINNNNFYANSPFDFVVLSSTNVNGQNNYWGTTDTGTILGRIFDKNDDQNRGLFDFQPFLLDATSPLPPPLDLQGNFTDTTANLTWMGLPSNTATYGYKVYYDTDGAPPYDGTGLPQGDSPIDVGSATSFNLTGIDPRIVVAVTAYDQNSEGWYSNQVDNLAAVYLPIVIK